MMSLRQFNLKPITQAVLISAVVSTLAACGGSGSDSNPNNAGNEPDSTSFSLAVSDAPVDQANEVVVYFDTVELIGEDVETLSYDELLDHVRDFTDQALGPVQQN